MSCRRGMEGGGVVNRAALIGRESCARARIWRFVSLPPSGIRAETIEWSIGVNYS